ncbi:MAG: cell surface protein SprA, partial [Cyclobacteriaceae bacterium]|nr:cell surface protein SprA [Cyclobacteriaceae bacterium]
AKSNGEIVSEVFQQFEENLLSVRNKFIGITGNEGYDTTSQDVLIPAFIGAYTGKDINTMGLSPFPQTPLPNWRIDYTGLSKIKFFSNIFQSITLSHAYQSTYSVTEYINSQRYNEAGFNGLERPISDYNNGFYGSQANEQGDLIPVYVISGVTLSEQFQPLIGINMRTKSRVSARVEYKTKRDLALNVTNAQVTEAIAKDVAMELGYTKNNLKLPFRSQGRTIVLKNDVTFRMNLTVSDTRTLQRKINEENIFTSGNVNFQLRPNISYSVNQKLQIQMYFERNITDPKVSNNFRRATTKFGTQIRFNLAQ